MSDEHELDLVKTLEDLGLRGEAQDHNFRCNNCGVMQKIGATMWWISDSIQTCDPWDVIVQVTKAQRWNGYSSGWCNSCARSLEPKEVVVGSRAREFRAFLKRIF